MKDSARTHSMIISRLESVKKALRQEYLLLCKKDELTQYEARFAKSYAAISESISALLSMKRDLPSSALLAKTILQKSAYCLPEKEHIAAIIKEAKSIDSLSYELDNLETALTLEAVLSMKENINAPESDRLINLFMGIKRIDFNALTEEFDPLHRLLLKDHSYSDSDTKTQREYRQRIRSLSRDSDEKTAEAILYECKRLGICACDYVLASLKPPITKPLKLALSYLLLTLVLSFGFGFVINEWWAYAALFLPAYYASKSIIDGFILFGRTPERLCRLKADSKALNSEKTAIVTPIPTLDGIDTVLLSQKLTSLASTEADSNVRLLVLADLSSEQALTISEDSAAIDSVAHMINNLNEQENNRYMLIVRKREFNEAFQDYRSRDGKRGALYELSRYMLDGSHDFFATFGDCEWLIGAKYVLWNESGARLEMGAVKKLLSIALHPANKPRLKDKKVKSGFGIIAPYVEYSLESVLSSGLAKVFGQKPSRASIYSELFHEAYFNGIGLIDTRLYLMAHESLPPRRYTDSLTLESEMLRVGYASDAKCYDSFPNIPQGYYRRHMLSIKEGVINLRGVFMRELDFSNKLRHIDGAVRSLTPISVMANTYLVFRFYPPAAEFTALLGLSMWLFPCVFETVKAIILENNHEQQFYSGLLPSSVRSIKHLAYSVVMLPTLATKTVGAVVASLYCFVTRRPLNKDGLVTSDPISFYLLPELISLILLRSPGYSIRLLGLLFSLMPILLAFSESEKIIPEKRISFKETKELRQYIADSWRFFDNFVTAADNGLPPESVQFSPVYRISHKTSPADIGLYLLSCISAYDEKLISAQALTLRVESCLDSLDRLEKYSGCLFDKYSTLTLESCSQKLSFEENGIYLSSLVCLREGLNELGEVFDKAKILAERTHRLINDADIGIFYDSISGLMCKSFNAVKKERSDELFRELMDISRLGSFYAIAFSHVPKSHWSRLGRRMKKCGFYSGLGSPTGSLEEFFLPEIFIKSPQGSVCYESLKYALYVQKKAALANGIPFGQSACSVYRFTSSLEYKNACLGNAKASLTPYSDNYLCVSPYSVMLSLSYDQKSGIESLQKLKKAGAYSKFGFYEAIDYSACDKPRVVEILKSRHVGAAIASAVNVTQNAIIQKRFSSDRCVWGALELLEEQFLPSTKVPRHPNFRKSALSDAERFTDISPYYPRIRLMKAEGYSLILTDSAKSLALSNGIQLFSSDDKNSGFAAALRSGDELIALDADGGMECEFNGFGASFHKTAQTMDLTMSVYLHAFLPCEIRSFTIKNLTKIEQEATLLLFIEPSLIGLGELESAKRKLALTVERDDIKKVITVSRADSENAPRLAIGFFDDIAYSASFDKRSVFARSDDALDVFERADEIPPSLVSEPEPCIFLKAKLKLAPQEERSVKTFIMSAKSEQALYSQLDDLKAHDPIPLEQSSHKEAVMAQLILAKILFGANKQADRKTNMIKGFDENVPLMLMNLNDKNDDEKLCVFLLSYRLIREAGIPLQMAVLFNDKGRTERAHYSKLLNAAKEHEVLEYIYSQGGIIPIDEYSLTSEEILAITESAAFIASDTILPAPRKRSSFKQKKVSRVLPNTPNIETPVACGGFTGYEYIISEKPDTDWHHVLSNSLVGCVLTNCSLGATSHGDLGEKLILIKNGRYYDIINGSCACFSLGGARYLAKEDGFTSDVSVSVSQKGLCKRLDIKITADEKCRLAYIIEDKNKTSLVSADATGATFSYKDKYLRISSSKPCETVFDKEAFFSGEDTLNNSELNGFSALICELSGAEAMSFYLSLGASEKAAALMPKHFFKQEIKPNGSKELEWAKYQLIYARLNLGDGKGVFDYCGLLQDAIAIAKSDPYRCRTEILRCCHMQFSEGDAVPKWKKGEKTEVKRQKHPISQIWLAYAVSEYVAVSDDRKLLDTGVGYFESHAPKESVYEHCRQAIAISIEQKGTRGLIYDSEGCESVALSAFLVYTLKAFSTIASKKGDNMYSAVLLSEANKLKSAINAYGQDNGHYINGYSATGEIVGSSKSEYCKISLMPQVMAFYAGINSHFDKMALTRCVSELVDKKRLVVKSFAPPYPFGNKNAPVKIRYLPPGIKENGGMITSEAILLALALIESGHADEANGIFDMIKPETRAGSKGYNAEPYYVCGEISISKNCFGMGSKPLFNDAAALYYKYLDEEEKGFDL